MVVKSLSQHAHTHRHIAHRNDVLFVCVCVRAHISAFIWPVPSFKANGVNKGTNRLLLGTLVLPGNGAVGAAQRLVQTEVDSVFAMPLENP